MEENNVERIKDVIDIIDQDFLDPSIITDNILYFDYKKESYRVLMPSPKDLSDAEIVKNQTYGKLLNTDGYHLLDNLKNILKEKQNIDIDSMFKEKDSIIKELEDNLLLLASYGESKKLDKIDDLKDKINTIKIKLRDHTLTIEKYLYPSIEKQMEARYIEFLTYLCTEKLVNVETEEYKRVWNSIKDFEADRSSLPIKSLDKMTQLLLNSREIL